jgi:segregation and condensation protein B
VTREKSNKGKKGKSAPPSRAKSVPGPRAKIKTEPTLGSDRPTLEDFKAADAFTPPPDAYDGALEAPESHETAEGPAASDGHEAGHDGEAVDDSEPIGGGEAEDDADAVGEAEAIDAAEAMGVADAIGVGGIPGNDGAPTDESANDAEDDEGDRPTGKPPDGATDAARSQAADAADADVEQARELTDTHLRGLLEALVFASDKPMKTGELARLASAPSRQVKEVMGELRAEYSARGIVLDEVAGGWLFRTNAQYAPFVRDLAGGRPVKLTRAQIETLAIAAYRQPITRPEIDEIRGVDSGATLKLLLERDLVRILGKKDEPGRPLLYGTTNHFLEFFNMKSLKDLPTLREFTELSDESRRVAEAELGEVLSEAAPPTPMPGLAAQGEPEVPPEEDLPEVPAVHIPFDPPPFDDGPLDLSLEETRLEETRVEEGVEEGVEEDEDSARETIGPPPEFES